MPPERLGDYLRDFAALLDEFGYRRRLAVRALRPGLRAHPDPVRPAHRRRASPPTGRSSSGPPTWSSSYGGSLSGEHGDGQSRGELLPKMFGDESSGRSARSRPIFDPGDRMNPGKVVAPEPARRGPAARRRLVARASRARYFAYPEDDGTFASARLRCVGVGKCRSHSGGGDVPVATWSPGEEEHSTRGRARLLFEMIDGTARPITDGWRSTEVRDALDLCLACKGCKSDCPVNVDMATYKAEFLAHHYAGRLRPPSHYSMGWLPAAGAAGHAGRARRWSTRSPTRPGSPG